MLEALALVWLMLGWDRSDLPSDSIARAFDILTEGETLNLNSVGFDGLRDSNRLRLIDDPTRRNEK